NNQDWATRYSATGVQSFEPTGDSETLATKSLVVSWSQRRKQQRSRLALKCAQEQDSVQASRPKVSKATQTLSYSPGSQTQRASQSCQQDKECQTTQSPTASQACEQTCEEGLSLSQGAADFSTAGALKDTVLQLKQRTSNLSGSVMFGRASQSAYGRCGARCRGLSGRWRSERHSALVQLHLANSGGSAHFRWASKG
ncbi:unnamed protein product, partial [Polarella glacialis]